MVSILHGGKEGTADPSGGMLQASGTVPGRCKTSPATNNPHAHFCRVHTLGWEVCKHASGSIDHVSRGIPYLHSNGTECKGGLKS
jgi:hypothetical protein